MFVGESSVGIYKCLARSWIIYNHSLECKHIKNALFRQILILGENQEEMQALIGLISQYFSPAYLRSIRKLSIFSQQLGKDQKNLSTRTPLY